MASMMRRRTTATRVASVSSLVATAVRCWKKSYFAGRRETNIEEFDEEVAEPARVSVDGPKRENGVRLARPIRSFVQTERPGGVFGKIAPDGSENDGAVGVECEAEGFPLHSVALENHDEGLDGDGGGANVEFNDFVERGAQRVFDGVCKHEQVKENGDEDADRTDHGYERLCVGEETRENRH